MADFNKKRILLVTASFEEISIGTVTRDNKAGMKEQDDASHYPLGLAYLHSFLESKGHHVMTLFLNNHPHEFCFQKVSKELKEFKPDIVSFQILTSNRISTFRLIEFINKNFPQIKIIGGGIHATIMYEQLTKKFPYLILIRGEGEITFAELINELGKKIPNFYAVGGIAFNDNGKIVANQPRALIENLDALPFPKHEIFFASGKRTCGDILTARGCPFSCSFCCLDMITRRRFRTRSIGNVMEEIEWMIDKFPQMKSIWIHDDTFFIDNQRVIEFCDEILKRKMKLDFICSGRFKPISEEMVRKLEQANFKRVLFGMESGDEKILEKCHKGITQADMIKAFEIFAKTNITIYCHLIVGLPGETLETITETASFIKKMQKIKYVNYTQAPYILSVYPGTEIYEIAKQGGMINDDYWLTDKPVPIFTLENDATTLFEFQEILTNNINPIRAFATWTGLNAQFSIIPFHVKHIFKNRHHLKTFAFHYLRFLLPERIFNILRKSKHPAYLKKVAAVMLNNLLPKKLKYGKKSYSQAGEDLIIKYIFDLLKIGKPTYLDIGAYHPIKISNTYLFYKAGSRGVCVEPDPYLWKQFKKTRNKDTCLNIGIGAENKESSNFYIMSSKTLNTFSQKDAEELAGLGTQKIEKIIKIDLANINWVIENYFKNTPNLINIDTEGMDLAILKSLDLNRHRPDVVCAETLSYSEDNSEKKDDLIRKYMEKNNYMLYADTYTNSIFVDADKWKNRPAN